MNDMTDLTVNSGHWSDMTWCQWQTSQQSSRYCWVLYVLLLVMTLTTLKHGADAVSCSCRWCRDHLFNGSITLIGRSQSSMIIRSSCRQSVSSDTSRVSVAADSYVQWVSWSVVGLAALI